MAPLSPPEIAYLIAALMFLAVCLYLVPSCGDPTCTATHAKHRGAAALAERAAAAERNHNIFHEPTKPQANCSLCQARKRE